jgi:hypothetical protein
VKGAGGFLEPREFPFELLLGYTMELVYSIPT